MRPTGRERSAKVKRLKASVSLAGRYTYLGRWPSKNQALLARQRAQLYYGLNPVGATADEARRLGAASPDELKAEARRIPKVRTSSGYQGVSWCRGNQQWKAEIKVRNVRHHVGYFDSEEEAAVAYDRVAKHLRSRQPLNFPNVATRPAAPSAVHREIRQARKLDTSSRYIGVSRDPLRRERPWFASLMVEQKGLALGRYRTEREAAMAHDRAALWYRPARVTMNFPGMGLEPASVEMLTNEILRGVKNRTKSRFVGVSHNGISFTASISHRNQMIYLGSFDTEEEAASVRDREALRLRGPDAVLNFDPTTGDERVGRRVSGSRR
jgi:hypothetical protein